jgi:2-isopropylmalate synthase
MSSEVKIYDTTLRDGNQARGLSFSLSDKLLVTEKLIDFGVDYIEGGWPNPTNPLDVEYFQKASHFNWKHTKMVAFGSTRRPSKTAETDPILNALVAANTPVYTIFGKSWDIHVTDVIKCELAQNLEMIHSSIAFFKEKCRRSHLRCRTFF